MRLSVPTEAVREMPAGLRSEAVAVPVAPLALAALARLRPEQPGPGVRARRPVVAAVRAVRPAAPGPPRMAARAATAPSSSPRGRHEKAAHHRGSAAEQPEQRRQSLSARACGDLRDYQRQQ